METEPQISFLGLDASPATSDRIREKIAKLEKTYDRITSCRVAVEQTRRKGRKGHLFKVSVELEVPGGTVIANRDPGDIHAHEDLNVAIRDSFDAAHRQLADYARKRGGIHVKSHPEKQHGKVARLFPDDGYGFIETESGEEVYFERDSVVEGDWADIKPGSDLHFSRMDGDKGPFAVNISLRD